MRTRKMGMGNLLLCLLSLLYISSVCSYTWINIIPHAWIIHALKQTTYIITLKIPYHHSPLKPFYYLVYLGLVDLYSHHTCADMEQPTPAFLETHACLWCIDKQHLPHYTPCLAVPCTHTTCPSLLSVHTFPGPALYYCLVACEITMQLGPCLPVPGHLCCAFLACWLPCVPASHASPVPAPYCHTGQGLCPTPAVASTCLPTCLPATCLLGLLYLHGMPPCLPARLPPLPPCP